MRLTRLVKKMPQFWRDFWMYFFALIPFALLMEWMKR